MAINSTALRTFGPALYSLDLILLLVLTWRLVEPVSEWLDDPDLVWFDIGSGVTTAQIVALSISILAFFLSTAGFFLIYQRDEQLVDSDAPVQLEELVGRCLVGVFLLVEPTLVLSPLVADAVSGAQLYGTSISVWEFAADAALAAIVTGAHIALAMFTARKACQIVQEREERDLAEIHRNEDVVE